MMARALPVPMALPPEFAALVSARRLFYPDTVKVAALDVWIRQHVCPRHWPYDTRRKVIEDCRAGKSARQISRSYHVDVLDIKRIARVVNCADVESALRNCPDAVLRDQRGIAALEFALVAPLMITLILGGINVGLAISWYQRLTFAAQSAATCGASGQCADTGAVIAYADARAGIPGAEFTASNAPCGTSVGVNYTFNMIRMFPDIPLTASACMPSLKPGA